MYLLKNLDINDLQYSNARINTFGGQSVFVTHNENKLRFQTPKCIVPAGINRFTTNTGEEKLSLSINIDLKTESSVLFKKFLSEFDEKNITTGTSSSYKWFKKHLSRDIIEKLYRKQLNDDNFKVKLLFKKGEFDGDVFDKNNKEVSLAAIKPGCKVRAIIECVGMYFVPNEFGVTWKAIQIKVEEEPERLTGYSFLDDEEETYEDAEPTI